MSPLQPAPTKDQEQRMVLIETALKGWKGDPSTLFDVATWMPLIMNAVSGTTEARKYEIEEQRKNLARAVIEQIVSPLYQSRVTNILSSNYARNQNHKNEPSRVGRNFTTLCKEYNAKMAKQRLAQEYESSSFDDDSSDDLENSRSSLGGFVTDDTDTKEGRFPDANELMMLTDNQEEESLCGEMENLLYENKSQTKNLQGTDVKNTSLRGRNQLKSRRFDTQGTINNHESILATVRTSADNTSNHGTLDDDIIENETPPVIPLIDTIDSNNDGRSPEKKSRPNSEELNPAVETRRTIRPIRRCGMTVRTTTSGMLERTATGIVDEESIRRASTRRNEDQELITKGEEVPVC